MHSYPNTFPALCHWIKQLWVDNQLGRPLLYVQPIRNVYFDHQDSDGESTDNTAVKKDQNSSFNLLQITYSIMCIIMKTWSFFENIVFYTF